MLIITLSILATCLVSSNCSVTHVRWREGSSSVLFQWRPAFSALWRCGNEMKWNESGFRPPLCTYRLNWARRTSWGWWDDWDDTVLQTQDSKFEPWRSEAEHATSRSRRLPTILTFTRGWGRNIFVSFKPPRPGTEPRTLAWKAAVLTTTLGPPPLAMWKQCCLVHHINNFWNTQSNLAKLSGQSPQWLRMVCAKFHVKRLRIDWDINEKRFADVVTTLAQCFALITFEVLNQTPPNLLGSCRSSSRWYLQNYIKNGWELTSELTSKWIYILKYSSKFHTNLINNFWSTRSNSTEFTGQWP